jgi:recombination protein RecT
MSSDLARRTREQQQQGQTNATRSQALVAKISAQRTGIAQALGDAVGPDKFLRAAATEIRTTKHLDECTLDSILGGLYVAAQLGLEVGGPRGHIYLVPFRNTDTGNYEASLIIGYKGWVELFYRAGARSVQWFLVREGDQFRIGSDPVHGKVYRWEQRDPNSTAEVTGAVAQVETATGSYVWEYLSRADIDKRATGTPFWRKWPDEMRLKTVLRRLQATAPTTPQLALAAKVDETVQRRVEVPGLEPEIRGEHLAVAQHPNAPTPPATPGQRPAPPAAPRPRQEAQETPGEREPVEPDLEPADEDEDAWNAQQIAEHERALAEQGEEGDR